MISTPAPAQMKNAIKRLAEAAGGDFRRLAIAALFSLLAAPAFAAVPSGSYPTRTQLRATNGSGPNATNYLVDWTQLGNVPAGFADGVDATGSGSGSVSASTDGVNVSSPISRIDFRADQIRVFQVSAGVIRVEISSGGIVGALIADNTLSLSKFDQLVNGFASTTTPNIVVAYSTSTGKVTGLTPLTTFYDLARFGTPDFGLSSSNTYDASASTNPYFGRMKFDGSASSGTNCGFYEDIAPNDWNQGIDPRLNQFEVMVGSTSDTGKHRYRLLVSSVTNNTAVLNLTYGNAVVVDFGTAATSNSGARRFQTTTATLTGWGAAITPGAPYAVKVCRDGNDGTNDTSTIDSYMVGWQMRYAHTTPGD